MAKAAQKSDMLNMPAFDTSAAVDQMRAFAEKGMEQSRDVYARFKSGAEEAQKVAETTFETARSVGADLSLKTVAAMRANADAGFSHLEALVGAKSLSEVMELQAAYFRDRLEMTVDQAKDFQSSLTAASETLAKPAKTAIEKAVASTSAAVSSASAELKAA